MSFAKLSSAFLMERVAPQSRRSRTILFATVGAWSVFALFVTSFRCGIPIVSRSEPLHCGSSGPLITSIVLNAITDVVLAAWMFPTLLSLSLDKEKRLTAMVLFGSRIVYPHRTSKLAHTDLCQGSRCRWRSTLGCNHGLSNHRSGW